MLSKHDELLLKDIRLQPLWLLGLYVVLGVASAAMGLVRLGGRLDALLCVGGGFLLALGAEKLVTRRIRSAAASLIGGDVGPVPEERRTNPSQSLTE